MEPRVADKPGMGFYSEQDEPRLGYGTQRLQNGLEWQSSEYIHHEKSIGWMLALIGVTVLFVAVAILLLQWSLAVVLVIMMIAFGYYAVRKPRVITYKLDHDKLTIGAKEYPLTSFRSFGVVKEGAFYSIRLIPVRRFGLLQAAYVSDKEGEAVVDILGAHLPMEEMHTDPIERFMSKLRF